MEERPNYYAIIPADVRYDENLKLGEKMMYGEITALSNKVGVCYASNNYFAKLYKVSPQAISKWINALEKQNYITISYQKEGKMIVRRDIKMVSTCVDTINHSLGGYQQEIKENNTSINNTSKKEIYKERFKKPTLEEVVAYCKERNNTVDAKRFFDYYDVANWKDVKNWKQKLITWESHQPTKQKEQLPEWFDKDLDIQEITEEEEKETQNIINSFD